MGWRQGRKLLAGFAGAGDQTGGWWDGGSGSRTAFGASVAYIYKALIRHRATGDSGINPRRGHRPRKLSCDQELAMGRIPCASGHHAGTGQSLASDQAWRRAQHGRHLECCPAPRLIVQKSFARVRAGQA